MTGSVSKPSGLITAYVLDGKGGGRNLDPDGVRLWSKQQGVLWAHFDLRGADTREWITYHSELDPLVAEALLAEETRPRSMPGGIISGIEGGLT